MGCCISKSGKKTKTSHSSSKKGMGMGMGSQCSRSDFSNANGNKAPPLMEEESVKEVLSEIPTPKPPPPPPPPIEENKTQKSAMEEVREEDEIEKKTKIPIGINPVEEISEISDICSFSETLSTTTITEKMDDYEEIRQRVSRSPTKLLKNKSFSDDKREKLVGKSPSRKPDQSPSRRNGTVKLIQNREMRMGLPRPSLQQQNSRPRSRSPSTTRAAVGRSPSVRKTGMSPGRDSKWKETAQKEEKCPTTNESLENPLVSLECFIFL